YENDFIDMGLIASGGFGNVYLAENKLTGVKYAVKCVIMKKKSSIKHCVNEVKIISRYNHPNIVAFNSAWIEGDYLDEEHVDDNETDIETDDDYYSEEEVNDDDDDDDESRTSDSDSVVQYEAPKPKKNYLKLYIQMELCKNTLEEWMNKRTEQTSPIVIEEILLQLLNALDYIHKKDAVHHDIKPSNIFIDTTEGIQIKLGDFGLACFERQKNHPAMGTQVYAAPEQLQGQCDPKSDIYSVGIILFELLFHIPTAMERSNYITLLKQGKFDDDHHKKYPEWCDLIKLILQNDPTKRPSAKKLL
ncbi:eukaryotic translation initiation factor 2-alpha kinase 3-like, partial [Aphidius gifuensis]|uniref:eukaryotic translation initiation factor 2-alpha kinase 3-like n=1 Tax=Aphidius gifuensis TaxID=684658 RepID=UPI001CDC0F70